MFTHGQLIMNRANHNHHHQPYLQSSSQALSYFQDLNLALKRPVNCNRVTDSLTESLYLVMVIMVMVMAMVMVMVMMMMMMMAMMMMMLMMMMMMVVVVMNFIMNLEKCQHLG